MPTVHHSAIIEGDVALADSAVIGPNCVLDGRIGPITVADDTRLIGHVYLTGPLTMGERNLIYPFVTLGFAPQDLKWDPANPGAGLNIGKANTFREHASIHRATSDDNPTTVGDENYFMANSHAGHDCRVGSHCIFANNVALAGHVRADDRVNIGGGTVIHQFVRLGRGSMLSGGMGTGLDVPPFFMLTGINIVGSINLIGMRRSDMPRDQIDDVRWVYRVLYHEGRTARQALEELRTRADRPIVAEYIDFIESSKRGVCEAVGNPKRGTA